MRYKKYFDFRGRPLMTYRFRRGGNMLVQYSEEGNKALDKNAGLLFGTSSLGSDRWGQNGEQQYESLYNDLKDLYGEDLIQQYLNGEINEWGVDKHRNLRDRLVSMGAGAAEGATATGLAGAAVGSVFPGLGNLIGGTVGLIGGGLYGAYRNGYANMKKQLKKLKELHNQYGISTDEPDEDVVEIEPSTDVVASEPPASSEPSTGGGGSTGATEVAPGSIYVEPAEPGESDNTPAPVSSIDQSYIDMINEMYNWFHNNGNSFVSQPDQNTQPVYTQPQVTRESLLNLNRRGRRSLRRGERTMLDNGAYVQAATRRGGRQIGRAVRKAQRQERKKNRYDNTVNSFLDQYITYPSETVQSSRYGGVLGQSMMMSIINYRI